MVEASQLLEEADSLRSNQGNLSGALEKINAVLDFDTKNIAVLVQKAIIERDLGKISQAFATVKQIKSVAKDTRAHEVQYVIALRLEAEFCVVQGKYDTASEKIDDAVAAAEKLAKPELLALALLVRADSAYARGLYDDAQSALAAAQTLAEQSHFSELLVRIDIRAAALAAKTHEDVAALAERLDTLIERSKKYWIHVWFEAVIARAAITTTPETDFLKIAKEAYTLAADNGWVYAQAQLAHELARFLMATAESVAVEYQKTAAHLFDKLGRVA